MEDFFEAYRSFLSEFGQGRHMVLSTYGDGRVTSRMMSVVLLDGAFCFQTDKTFRKYRQLICHPRAALCADNIQIEGVCEETGHPLDDPDFCGLYRSRFASSFDRYSFLDDERLFRLKPTYVQRWLYIGTEPYIEEMDVENKARRLIRYEGR